jgi:hypothetical protein
MSSHHARSAECEVGGDEDEENSVGFYHFSWMLDFCFMTFIVSVFCLNSERLNLIE